MGGGKGPGAFKGTQGATKPFKSRDKYVGEMATAIESKFPGKVEAVNKKILDSSGSELVEYDIELDNAVIQVKSQQARGLVGQLVRTAQHTKKEAIGYAPDISHRHGMVKDARIKGFRIFTTENGLLKYLDKKS